MLLRLWNLLCSLKLTIWLASLATLLTMVGSLLIHFYPSVFGDIEAGPLGSWLTGTGAKNLRLSFWLYLASGATLLLGINTLCCFLDWLPNWRSRWRKTGEYLIHLGFVFLVISFVWGSLAGARSDDQVIAVGESLSLEKLVPGSGYSLRLDAFEPLLGESGRPMDMLSTVTLLQDGQELMQQQVHSNTPLLHDGLVVIGRSYGSTVEGFLFATATQRDLPLRPGDTLEIADGGMLRVLRFYPDAMQRRDGKVFPRGAQLGDPAIELELIRPGSDPWRGWYHLRQSPPLQLKQAGVILWPQQPLLKSYSVFTINRDPGAALAMTAGVLMALGACVALFSFYRKRARGDRPDIA